MEDNEPESQSLSLQVQGTAQWARELSGSCKEGSQGPGGQQGRQSPQSSRAEPLAANAQGDQRGASVWCVELGCLNSGLEPASVIPLKVEYSTLLDLFDKCLATSDAKCGIFPGVYGWYMTVLLDTLLARMEFAQEPIYGWSRSADTAALTMCADILSVSPCQMCLLWLRSFSSWTKVSWLTDSHLGWHEWLHFVLYTLCCLNWTNAILLVLLSTSGSASTPKSGGMNLFGGGEGSFLMFATL